MWSCGRSILSKQTEFDDKTMHLTVAFKVLETGNFGHFLVCKGQCDQHQHLWSWWNKSFSNLINYFLPLSFLYMAQLTWAPKHDVHHHEIEGHKLRPAACDRETEVQQDWNSSETMGTTGLDWTVYLRYFQNDYPPHLGTRIWTLPTLDCDSKLCFFKKRFLEFRAMISCWEVSWIWKSLLSLVSPWCIPFCSLRLLYGSASKRDMLRQIDLLAWSIP